MTQQDQDLYQGGGAFASGGPQQGYGQQPLSTTPRRLDIGKILTGTFRTYGAQATLLIPAGLLIFLPVLILQLVLGLFPTDSAAVAFFVVLPLSVLISLAATYLFQGVVVQAVEDMIDGRRDFTLGTLLKAAVPFIGPLLLAGVLAGLAIAVGFLLLIVPGIILATFLYVVGPTVVMERSGPIDAFGRSFRLVSGNFWPVLGVVVVIFLIGAVANWVLGGIFGFGGPVVAAIGNYLAAAIVGPLGAIAAATTYLELSGRSAAVAGQAAPGQPGLEQPGYAQPGYGQAAPAAQPGYGQQPGYGEEQPGSPPSPPPYRS